MPKFLKSIFSCKHEYFTFRRETGKLEQRIKCIQCGHVARDWEVIGKSSNIRAEYKHKPVVVID